jgi:tail tube protein gp19
MDQDRRRLGRRDVLKLGAVAAAVAGTAQIPLLSSPALAQGGDIAGFLLDIPGAPVASKNIREIHIDELNIDERALTTQGVRILTDVKRLGPLADVAMPELDYRVYGPGDAHFGSATFTFRVDKAVPNKDVEQWVSDCSRGQNIRKSISVILLGRDGSEARRYNLLDCFPTQWSAVNFDTSSSVQTETLRVKVGRIEFKT